MNKHKQRGWQGGEHRAAQWKVSELLTAEECFAADVQVCRAPLVLASEECRLNGHGLWQCQEAFDLLPGNGCQFFSFLPR